MTTISQIKIEEERYSAKENEEVNKIAHLAGAFSHMLRKTMDGTAGKIDDIRVGMASPTFEQSFSDSKNLSRERYLNTCMPSEDVIREEEQCSSVSIYAKKGYHQHQHQTTT